MQEMYFSSQVFFNSELQIIKMIFQSNCEIISVDNG